MYLSTIKSKQAFIMLSRVHYLFVLVLFSISHSGTCNRLGEAMEANGVVPDVIEVAPQEVVQVSYPSGVKVDLGNELTPTQVKDDPSLKWNGDQDTLYTVAMVDPDAPSRKEPTLREVLHWLVGNVPGTEVQKGVALAGYRGSGPPLGTGLHRYVFLIYKQSGRIEFDEKPISKTSREGRLKFSIKKFAEKYNLGQPVWGNFYQAQYDDYVPTLHKQTDQ
ncbi:unnamed protein product [Phaedon cochleariae]|uniref:Phosphatidylethanolamine-binding protein n=1 Tax=Phaedon cochleariae TaxID=80249 RepID=A0A9P0DNU4_PHACE|nr:unnamed protein product [Phaedon cochleariae]